MVELPLNGEALKQFIDFWGGGGNVVFNKQYNITLVLQYGGDISLSHLYFHLPSARENNHTCS